MSDSELIDISVLVSPDTPVWPGDTPFSCLWTWDMAQGSSVNVSAISMSPHDGTHADTPLHVTSGADGSETLPIDAFRGAVVVVDVSDVGNEIGLDVLDARVAKHASGATSHPERILLKTGRTIASGAFPDEWPSLTTQCAQELAQRGLRLLGVDCPSVDQRESKTLDVHHALLDNGTCVLENLDLRVIDPGVYTLDALPMKVAGLDAAPVRAVLVR